MTTCAMCRHFTIMGHAQQADAGLGHCVGYLASLEIFVAWDRPICGIYRESKQKEVAARQKFIEIHKGKKA